MEKEAMMSEVARIIFQYRASGAQGLLLNIH